MLFASQQPSFTPDLPRQLLGEWPSLRYFETNVEFGLEGHEIFRFAKHCPRLQALKLESDPFWPLHARTLEGAAPFCELSEFRFSYMRGIPEEFNEESIKRSTIESIMAILRQYMPHLETLAYEPRADSEWREDLHEQLRSKVPIGSKDRSDACLEPVRVLLEEEALRERMLLDSV